MTDCCNSNIYDLECDINKSLAVKQLKAKDQQLQSQIDSINNKLWDESEWSIGRRLDNVEACCEDKQEKIDQTNTVISEIGDNITLLKWMYTRQDIKINSLLRNVIIDETYLNFSDWVENVYIPQWESLENKYTQWDIYMNVNQNVWATNAVYVCIRSYNSKNPLSANDWQELYYSAPSDVQAILWIDPVQVHHPYKHEWVISIDPYKLSDMIAWLNSLDLSNVDVTLWDVYFNPTIKESVTIQENLTVWNTATVKTLEWESAHIWDACIDKMTCDTNFTWKPTFLNAELTWTLDAHEVDADVANIDTACINKMTCDTDFVDVIPEFWTVNVQTELNTKRLEWEWAHIKKACIEEMVCDTQFAWMSAEEWWITNLNVSTLVQEWWTATFNWPVEFNWNVELNIVEWDTTFNDVINAPDINVSNNITTENLTVNDTTTLNWPVNIKSYINYEDNQWKTVCIGNAIENLFRPSYWLFSISGNGASYAPNQDTNILFWLWSDWIRTFNNAQWADAVTYVPVWTQNNMFVNNTQLIRDEENTTPWVELHKDTNFIMIHWENWEDSWLYTIEFNMTIWLDDVSENTPMNVWSHRAWVVVYDKDNLRWRIIDDKTEASQNLYKYTFSHNHSYYDSDTWEDSSGSTNRTTQDYVFNLQNPDRCFWWNGRSDVVIRAAKYYTYTKTLTIPVSSLVIVAPYFKPSAWCATRGAHFTFSIPTWIWNTWSEAQIFVHKVANLWVPYEYHC